MKSGNSSVFLEATAVLVCCLAVSAARAAAPAAAPNPQAMNAVTGQPNISGIWSLNTTDFVFSGRPSAERKMRTIDGQAPPLQPWAAKLYDERAHDSDVGTPFPTPASKCLPNGTPMGMYDATYGIQIIQSPGQVTLLHEEPGDFRVIRLDEPHPEELFPSFGGHSIGHFEADTLVVDTIGLNGDTTLDTLGMPHTDKLHVTERIRRTAPEALEIVFTLDDPGAFTKPWAFRKTYKLWPPGQQILEYVCLENQRNSTDESGKVGFGK